MFLSLIFCLITFTSLHYTTNAKLSNSNLLGSIINVLVLDVDGTLYDNDCLIEQQIVSNIEEFAAGLGIDKVKSQSLYHEFGSTIRGVIENGLAPRNIMHDYCNQVYASLDLNLLRKYSSTNDQHHPTGPNTGYTQEMTAVLEAIRQSGTPVVIASNSPSFHVKRVLSRLGLYQLPITAILTPDLCGGYSKTDTIFWEQLFQLYPLPNYTCTLVDDSLLNCQFVQTLGMKSIHINSNVSLVDAIIRFHDAYPLATTDGSRTLSSETSSAEMFQLESWKYLEAKNIIDNKSFNIKLRRQLVMELAATCSHSYSQNNHCHSHRGSHYHRLVIDIGAGLLNMLTHVTDVLEEALLLSRTSDDSMSTATLHIKYIAFESNVDLFPSIADKLQHQMNFLKLDTATHPTILGLDKYRVDVYNGVMISNATVTTYVTVWVVALDALSDEALHAIRVISAMNLSEKHTGSSNSSGGSSSSSSSSGGSQVDLVVGCCVADLIAPRLFVNRILEMCNDNGALLYLPITFTGRTRLLRHYNHRSSSSSHNSRHDHSTRGVDHLQCVNEQEDEQDTRMMAHYQNHLLSSGHHTDPLQLVRALQQCGCDVLLPEPATAVTVASTHKLQTEQNKQNIWSSYLSQSRSDWLISSERDKYMWQCMTKFISTGVFLQCLTNASSTSSTTNVAECVAWIKKLNNQVHGKSTSSDVVIQARNIDILARLPRIHKFFTRVTRPVMTNDATDVDRDCDSVLPKHATHTKLFSESSALILPSLSYSLDRVSSCREAYAEAVGSELQANMQRQSAVNCRLICRGSRQ